jgi:hypothetical protein
MIQAAFEWASKASLHLAQGCWKEMLGGSRSSFLRDRGIIGLSTEASRHTDNRVPLILFLYLLLLLLL